MRQLKFILARYGKDPGGNARRLPRADDHVIINKPLVEQ